MPLLLSRLSPGSQAITAFDVMWAPEHLLCHAPLTASVAASRFLVLPPDFGACSVSLPGIVQCTFTRLRRYVVAQPADAVPCLVLCHPCQLHLRLALVLPTRGACCLVQCQFFDDDLTRGQFHCDDCGICRVGGAANFFHCSTCACCYSIGLKARCSTCDLCCSSADHRASCCLHQNLPAYV